MRESWATRAARGKYAADRVVRAPSVEGCATGDAMWAHWGVAAPIALPEVREPLVASTAP